MATINGLQIFVETEALIYEVEATEHPVEEGINLASHVSKKPTGTSLAGYIVGDDAKDTKNKLVKMMKNGTIVDYKGVTHLSKSIITKLNVTVANKPAGGYAYTLELKEIRVASSPYVKKNTKPKKTNGGTKKVDKKSKSVWVCHKVKKGDTVYALVTGPYKELGSTSRQIMQWNPSAFSRKGDYTTLKVGVKLKMGKRK